MTDVVSRHIEIVQGARGPKARIAGHRIRVQDVAIWHEKLGMSPDEIAHHHPTISLADIHAALAYYWDHQAELDQEIRRRLALADDLQRRTPPAPILERLRR